MRKQIKTILILLLVLVPFFNSSAQEVVETNTTIKGRVVEILDQETRNVPGTNTPHTYQTITAEILSGEKEGQIITIENDFLEMKPGSVFYANHFSDIDGRDYYSIINIERKNGLIILTLIFVLSVVLLSGWQGARSIIALIGSFLAIFYILIPGMLAGWSPVLASSLVAGSVLFFAIFFTHGFNRESFVAYIGTILSVVLTILLAKFAINITSLSGIATEESVYLNFNTQGSINFVELLLGGIIIGILGVLDDISITQVAVVRELYDSNKNMTKKEAYKRSIRVGKEHVSALVNTLILAYTGTSLPLLLLFSSSGSDMGFSMVNLEIFATEVVRTMVGSIGIIMTVPIVTLLAVVYLKNKKHSKSFHVHSHAHAHDHSY